MDDATKIVNEMVGEPDDIAKFVRAALPDVFLDSLVKWENDSRGDWHSLGDMLLVLKDVEGDDRILAIVEWHHNEDGSINYFIGADNFLYNYRMSPDWNWKDGGKWVKRHGRGSYLSYSSLPQVRRALLKEPMVQRRIARLTGKGLSEVESIVDKSIARERIQERIMDQLTQDGWTVQKSGFHATGRAYVVGRGPAETAKEAVGAVDIAAIYSRVMVEDIQSGKRGESAPWQVDFTIREDCEDAKPEAAESVEELTESDVEDFVQSYMGKWRVGRHTWGSGTTTYYVFKGIGDKQPDEHNRENLSYAVLSSWGAQQSADYMNWLEGAFMPSERFDNVEQWRTAATLAGMIKKWHSLLNTGKIQEGYEDVLQATVRAAIPSIDDLEKVSKLSKMLAALGISAGDIWLNYHEIHARRDNYEASIHVYVSEYPSEWNTVKMVNRSLAAPILQNAIDKAFDISDARSGPVNVAYSGTGFIAYRTFLHKGKIPTAPRTLFIYATIGQEAEYRSRPGTRMEAMSPADLVRATDMDATVRNIVTSMAARMKEMGAKGVVYAAKPGPDPLEPGKEMVEIGFHLTHAPAEEWYHGQNFMKELEKLLNAELEKYPDLLPQNPKAYGKVVMSLAGGEPILQAWIPFQVRGRFFTRKNVNIVLEAMTPSELYRKSIENTPLQLVLKIGELSHNLKAKGYHGEIGLKPSASHKGLNLVIVWLYKPDITINPIEMRSDIQSIWGNDNDRVLDMGFRHPAPTMPVHHQAFSFVTGIGGHSVAHFTRKIEEAMTPSELYRKSIQNTPIEARLKLSQVASSLAKHGYTGSIRIDPGSAGRHVVLIKLANVPREGCTYAPAQYVRDAFRSGGMQIDNYGGKWKPYPNDQDWGTVSDYVWLRTALAIPKEGLTVDIHPVTA